LLEPIANELGGTVAQLALAWCLKNPNVSTVITGASRPQQVHENMKALDLVDKLTDEVMQKIDDILANKP
jgi:aryl-alcohol dehydrogenase-like predicted oxidoreductase